MRFIYSLTTVSMPKIKCLDQATTKILMLQMLANIIKTI